MVESTALDTELHLEVTEDVPKIDVEKLAVLLHHHIARVAIADTHDVGRHQVACTGPKVILLGHGQIRLVPILILQKNGSCALIESIHQSLGVILVDLRVILSIDNLDEANLSPRGESPVDVHFEVVAILAPELIEDAKHLQDQIILLEIVAVLEHDAIRLPLEVRVGNTGQGKGQFFGIVHLAFLFFEGLEEILRSDGKIEPIWTELVEFGLYC